jgi:hypothetical protein
VEDADFYTYEQYLKKMVIEPNAVAQEAGLAAVLEYVSNAPNASRWVPYLIYTFDIYIYTNKLNKQHS